MFDKISGCVTSLTKTKFIKPSLKRAKGICQFAGCKEEYDAVIGGNPSKYCMEHRKREYRKIIDKDKLKKEKPKKEIQESTVNQIIKHSYKHPLVVVGECQLEGCGQKFDILIVPNTYIYPRYCPEHRNEFKRKRFLHGKTV